MSVDNFLLSIFSKCWWCRARSWSERLLLFEIMIGILIVWRWLADESAVRSVVILLLSIILISSITTCTVTCWVGGVSSLHDCPRLRWRGTHHWGDIWGLCWQIHHIRWVRLETVHDLRVSFLEFLKDFQAMLCLLEFSWKLGYPLEHHHS
jgi:hypothetical protein